MPIITIFGANGTQGSTVLEAVLADGKYTPRAISRSLDSAASKALIAEGVEVVVADLWDKESLKNAIRGSEVVFGITNFWDPEVFKPTDPKGTGEITQGKNLVDAAKEVGVKFFIWSSLPNSTKDSNGLYRHIHHFDNKAMIEDYLRASGVPFAVLLTGWFAENLWKTYGPENTQVFTWVTHDFGKAAVALLTNYADPSKGVLGKSYPVVTFRVTHPEFATAITKAIKKEVTFVPLETAGLAEMDEMYLYMANIGMYNDTPVPNSDLAALGVKFGTLEEFVQKELVARFA
ncbi:NAD(P)-binding protein [Mycena olivaceomarginata]|nr:NAD(P)-binding protein [Mycena olivaceomarginata]